MGDWFLVGWAALGAVAALAFAAGGVVHARRQGRRWHESVLASQAYSIPVAGAYVVAWLLVGPLWGLLLGTGLLTTAFCASVLCLTYAEHRAKRAVFARERGE